MIQYCYSSIVYKLERHEPNQLTDQRRREEYEHHPMMQLLFGQTYIPINSYYHVTYMQSTVPNQKCCSEVVVQDWSCIKHMWFYHCDDTLILIILSGS